MTKQIMVGGVAVGGGAPVTIQSMCNTKTEDAGATIEQILRLEQAGCEIVRVTVPTPEAAEAVEIIKNSIHIPLVADIHFDYRLAIAAAEHGADKIRINPGNIGGEDRVKAVVDCCRAHKVPIRIGVNGGSLEKELLAKYGRVTPEALVESALGHVALLEKYDFTDICISVKSSDVPLNMAAYRLLHERVDYPLHLGVTEAGEGEDGRIKSAVGIGALLADGIGDTLRVSLSEAPECEIPVAYALADYITSTRGGHPEIPALPAPEFDYLHPQRRPTCPVMNIGGSHTPVVVSYRPDGEMADWGTTVPDYVYVGRHLPESEQRREGMGYIVDADVWQPQDGVYPAFTAANLMFAGACGTVPKFLFLSYVAFNDEVAAFLRLHPETVIVAGTRHPNITADLRALVHTLCWDMVWAVTNANYTNSGQRPTPVA